MGHDIEGLLIGAMGGTIFGFLLAAFLPDTERVKRARLEDQREELEAEIAKLKQP